MTDRKILHKKGLTLLEPVLIVFAVLALTVLVLPKVFAMVDASKNTEAFGGVGNIRRAMEKCSAMNNGSYSECTTFRQLNIENPNVVSGVHFFYSIDSLGDVYTITATRNSLRGGDGTSQLMLILSPSGMTTAGSGIFSDIN